MSIKVFFSSEIEAMDEVLKLKSKKVTEIQQKNIKPRIVQLLSKRSYGSSEINLAVIPTIASDSVFLGMFGGKERSSYSIKTGDADFRLRISWDDYLNASTDKDLEKLLLHNIVKSIIILNQKVQAMNGDFAGELLVEDIAKEFGYNREAFL